MPASSPGPIGPGSYSQGVPIVGNHTFTTTTATTGTWTWYWAGAIYVGNGQAATPKEPKSWRGEVYGDLVVEE